MKSIFRCWLAIGLILFGSSAIEAAEKGHVYRHPTGLSFWYPQNWRLQELDEVLQLIPDDAVTTHEGPSEIYFVSGESITGTGITHADDPRVISYVDQQVRSVLPQLQLTSDRQHVKLMDTQGVVFKWSGSNNSGKSIEGRAYIVIARDTALILSAISIKGLIGKRNTSLEKIFTSFVLGEGQIDRALVGTWHKFATAALSNPDRIYQTAWSAAQSVSEDKSLLTFSNDGRWHRVDRSHTLVGASGIWLEDKSEKKSSGRWFADGKRLFMIFDDNTWEDYAYKVVHGREGPELRTSVGRKATIWRR